MGKNDYLRKFQVKSKNEDNNLENIFYKVNDANIIESENKLEIKLPTQLKDFYKEVGYGFFHRNQGSINRLLSPLQVAQINLREDFYELDPDLDVYFEIYGKEKILFFEVNEGLYLAIDTNGCQNRIYLFDKEIADSLDDFISKFLDNPNYINYNS